MASQANGATTESICAAVRKFDSAFDVSPAHA
jgi:hypothetical protein